MMSLNINQGLYKKRLKKVCSHIPSWSISGNIPTLIVGFFHNLKMTKVGPDNESDAGNSGHASSFNLDGLTGNDGML